MKITIIILLSLLALTSLKGCVPYAHHDADFAEYTVAMISEKNQDEHERITQSAVYTIKSFSKDKKYYNTIKLVLSETFGNVGDTLKFTNNTMYSESPKTLVEKP